MVRVLLSSPTFGRVAEWSIASGLNPDTPTKATQVRILLLPPISTSVSSPGRWFFLFGVDDVLL